MAWGVEAAVGARTEYLGGSVNLDGCVVGRLIEPAIPFALVGSKSSRPSG